jgi:diguanylate cyclase (GGDEF)-like protein
MAFRITRPRRGSESGPGAGADGQPEQDEGAGSEIDRLTGLWRFERWYDDLSRVSLERDGREKIGVVFLDLVDFRELNATFGEIRGDEVLAVIGERLRTQLPRWQFGRYAGDEFVGFVRHVQSEHHLEELCRVLGGILSEPITAGGVLLTTAGSVGRTLSHGRADDPARVVNRAEQDLRERQALRIGPPRLTENQIVERLLAQGLDVAYQPLFDARTTELVGWEALLRGRLPILGALSPERVVNSAARIGALDTVMRQVAEQALTTVTVASLRLGRRMSVSVNVEPDQLRPASPFLQWLIDRSASCPADLVLEITERSGEATTSAERDSTLDHLRRSGVGLAMDDLGQGEARLDLLALQEWSWVKLDRAFLLLGDRGLVLLRHVTAMLHELGTSVLLEGIETDEHLEIARNVGVDLVQGHLLGRPISAEELLGDLPTASPIPKI